MKRECVNGSFVNGVREPILYSFATHKPPGHKVYGEPGIKLFRRINISILSHMIIYLEDDDHKAVNFNGEMIGFNCHLNKI